MARGGTHVTEYQEAYRKSDFKTAERLYGDIVLQVRQAEATALGRAGDETASVLSNLAWYQLLAQDFGVEA